MALPQINIGDGLLGDALLSYVEVTQELNHHWWCTVVCRQTEDQRIPTEDLLGQPVEVKTIDEDGVEHIHFSGFVYDVALSYEVWGSYTARLTAVSDSYVLDVTAHKQYYTAGTLASLAGLMAGRSGLSIDVNAPGSKALNYVQYGETDFSFLNRIVDDHGAWLRPAAGGMEIFAAFQAGSKVQWRDHDGLIAFSLTGTLAPASFSGSHYDHHVMQSNTFEQIAKPPTFYDGAARLTGAVQSASQQLPAGFEPQRARAMTLDEYSDQLGAESERSMGGAVTGEGESRNQSLMAGNTLEIQGVLDAAGTYGLLKVVHQWTPAGYDNTFVCTPWKNYRNPHPPEMRLWEGVAPARVTAHNDPKKMGRLQVQFFWQEDGTTHWARMVSPHAGPDRGMMMMPEVGDEVAVMFEDGDPERPVVVGSMWNGVQQAPRAGFFGPEADIPTNDVKRIVTKSGHRLQMVDTPGTETVVLATPYHTHLHMTEKHDATGRTLIHLHSDGDIILTAPNGRVHIQSQFFSREIGTGAVAGTAPQGSLTLASYYPKPMVVKPTVTTRTTPDFVYDGCLIGKGCTPLTKKNEPGHNLSDQQIKGAWSNAYHSNSPCCKARRAAGQAPKRIVYVNGINTDKAAQCVTLQRIANQSCADVIGVHNSTQGFLPDVWQSKRDGDLINKARAGRSFGVHDGRNPAVDSMSDVMYNSVRDGNPPEIWAHSQGGAIASLASFDANNRLKNGGFTPGISGMQIKSFAAAAPSWPANANAQHFINIQDLVPRDFGLGPDPTEDSRNTGPNQQVIRFQGEPGAQNPIILSPAELKEMNEVTVYPNPFGMAGDPLPPTPVSNLPPAGLYAYHDINTTYLNAARKVDGGCSPDGK